VLVNSLCFEVKKQQGNFMMFKKMMKETKISCRLAFLLHITFLFIHTYTCFIGPKVLFVDNRT
jgi:hypothetical protein